MEAGFGGDSWSNVSNEDSGTAGWVTVFLGKRWESGYLSLCHGRTWYDAEPIVQSETIDLK